MSAAVAAKEAKIPEGGTPASSCPICCENKPTTLLWSPSKCSHSACRSCIVMWIQKVEATGQVTKVPSCPFCRVEMKEDEVVDLLGRPFQPREASTGFARAQPEADELTMQWLEEHTRPCPACGSSVEKMEGTCNLMECLCGFRFCFGCGSHGARCFCTPAHHFFWDNVLDCEAPRPDPPEAPRDLNTGSRNLLNHILQRKRDELAKKVRKERAKRRSEEEKERAEVDATTHGTKWLFCSNVASRRMLPQLICAEAVRQKRTSGRKTRQEEETPSSDWLFRPKQEGINMLEKQQGEQAQTIRRTRAEKRGKDIRETVGLDGVIACGHWLFQRGSRAKTLAQLERLFRHQTEWDNAWLKRNHERLVKYMAEGEDAKVNALAVRLFFCEDEAEKEKERRRMGRRGLPSADPLRGNSSELNERKIAREFLWLASRHGRDALPRLFTPDGTEIKCPTGLFAEGDGVATTRSY